MLLLSGPGLSAVLPAAAPEVAAATDPGQGWLYVHRYLNDRQREQRGGIASAPIFVFSESGALVRSGSADGAQPYGKLIPVAAGTYFVAAGRFHIGLTRQRYTVRPGKVTIIQTGFVQIETWPQEEQPRQGCNSWDAEMTLYGSQEGMAAPIFSNSRFQYNTRQFGMIQILTGKYRLGWHGFDLPVEIRAGQILKVALGTVGPLADPKGRLSRGRDEVSDSLSLRMCDDGPTHVLAGTYLVSYMKPLETYPYEERVWQQVEVPAINEPGYDSKRLGGGEKLARPLFTGPEAEPVAVPVQQELAGPGGLATPDGNGPAPAASAHDPLGSEIQWDSPP